MCLNIDLESANIYTQLYLWPIGRLPTYMYVISPKDQQSGLVSYYTCHDMMGSRCCCISSMMTKAVQL